MTARHAAKMGETGARLSDIHKIPHSILEFLQILPNAGIKCEVLSVYMDIESRNVNFKPARAGMGAKEKGDERCAERLRST